MSGISGKPKPKGLFAGYSSRSLEIAGNGNAEPEI